MGLVSLCRYLVILCWMVSVSTGAAQRCSSDAETLLKSPWAAQLGWHTSVDISEWRGMACDTSQGFYTLIRVFCRQLSNLNLSGHLPDAWSHLSQMVALEMQNSNLSGPLPSSWSNLQQLLALDLSKNSLTGDLPVTWSSMSQLTACDLSNNNLTGSLPPGWSNLNLLKQCALSYNGFVGTLPESWSNMQQLEALDLISNKLTGTLPRSWANLSQLAIFLVGNNHLSGSLPSSWSRVTNLLAVDFSYNRLTGSLPNAWSSLTQMEGADFAFNQLTGSLPNSWGNLTKSVAWNFLENDLNGTLPGSWGNQTQLKYFDIVSNSLTGTLPSEWSRMTHLEALDVSNNSLTGALPDTWEALTQMAYGIFGRNQLSGRASVLPNLTLLDLGHNNYTEVSFADLPSSLQLLYLGNNGLSGSMPPLLDLPANLTFLDISNNMLSGSLPAALPPNLAILNASGNSLSGSLPGNWSTAKRLAELRLDNNMFTGVLPASWSAWGKISRNSLQLSITNTSLHGRIPQQWVEQFCLAIVESSLPQILFEEHVLHVNVQTISRDVVAAPVIELPAQHASINVTLGVHFFSFDYNSPGSICGIPNAPRNIGLVWGIYAAVFLASIAVVQLWPSGRKRVCTAGVSSKLRNLRLSCCSGSSHNSICKRVAERLWFFLSDGVFSVYSQVTDAITIYQVFASKQLQYAFLLLAMWLVPALVMLAAVARVSAQVCQDQVSPYSTRRLTRVSLYLLGLLLSPSLLIGLQFAMILQGVGVPLPACLKLLNVDLYTFYRLQSFAESFLSALPQSVLQTKLYMMGNDPRGVHVYINTTLFLYSIVGSFFSVLKSVIILLLERRTYRCRFVTYCTTMLKLDSLKEYEVFSQETAAIELAASQPAKAARSDSGVPLVLEDLKL